MNDRMQRVRDSFLDGMLADAAVELDLFTEGAEFASDLIVSGDPDDPDMSEAPGVALVIPDDDPAFGPMLELRADEDAFATTWMYPGDLLCVSMLHPSRPLALLRVTVVTRTFERWPDGIVMLEPLARSYLLEGSRLDPRTVDMLSRPGCDFIVTSERIVRRHRALREMGVEYPLWPASLPITELGSDSFATVFVTALDHIKHDRRAA